MNLYLIGYRGSGKSTVGSLVAGLLGRDWFDTDDEIENVSGLTIDSIFSQFGEDHFRRLETEAIKKIRASDSAVVSLGGGAVLAQENRNWLRANGRMVWLKASPETLYQRMIQDAATEQQRPALTELDGLDEIRSVLDLREPLYSICADYQVEVEELRPIEVAEVIVDWWETLTDAKA